MISKKRRKFTSEFRAQVVLEVISGKLSVAQAASKYKIKDSAIYEWRKAALERLPLLFEMKPPEQEGQEHIGELERMIGQLTVENDALKKASRWLSQVSKPNEKQ
jgi:transposase-like protein